MAETKQSQLVTRSEFESFANRVDGAFSSLTKKLDEQSKPQYGLLVSVVGLIVTVVGGGYFVVTSQVESAKELAAAQHENLQQQVLFLRDDLRDCNGKHNN